jgi:hypothetical protein
MGKRGADSLIVRYIHRRQLIALHLNSLMVYKYGIGMFHRHRRQLIAPHSNSLMVKQVLHNTIEKPYHPHEYAKIWYFRIFLTINELGCGAINCRL